MPKFKTELVSVGHGTGGMYLGDGNEPINCSHKYDIMLNTRGQFYANLPDFLKEAGLTMTGKRSNRSNHVQVFDKTYEGLIQKLVAIHDAYMNPEVKETLVIAFNIKTSISFAQTPAGEIFPNCTFHEDAAWPPDDGTYSIRGSSMARYGGYSLEVGAKALTKTTRRYGNGSVRTSYENYYGPKANHFDREHPAARLNHWSGFRLDAERARQIPYTDEAAEFFYDLLLGMAKLAQRIQAHISTDDDLLKLINSRQRLLAAPPDKSDE